MHYNILSVKRISWKKIAERILEAKKNDLGLIQGLPVSCDTRFQPHLLCFQAQFVDKKKTCLTIVKQSLFYQKCLYSVQTMFVCVSGTKQLTPPTFSPCISVKLKRLWLCKVGEHIVTKVFRLYPATIAEETHSDTYLEIVDTKCSILGPLTRTHLKLTNLRWS